MFLVVRQSLLSGPTGNSPGSWVLPLMFAWAMAGGTRPGAPTPPVRLGGGLGIAQRDLSTARPQCSREDLVAGKSTAAADYIPGRGEMAQRLS